MANFALWVETRGGQPLPGVLEALGQARRIATALGATIYAVVTSDQVGANHPLGAVLGKHGADRVIWFQSSAYDEKQTARWMSHGPALIAILDALSPVLFLFPATPSGRELARRSAARSGAALLQRASFDLENGALVLAECAGSEPRTFGDEIDFPVVAVVPPGHYQRTQGGTEADIEIIDLPKPKHDLELIEELSPAPRVSVVASPALESVGRELEDALGEPAKGGAIECLIAVGKVEADAPGNPLRVQIGNGASRAEYLLQGDAAAQVSALVQKLKDSA